MDFGLSEEQQLLKQSARDFLTERCPPALVRDVADDEDGFPRTLYRDMASLGWSGLIIPETYGGAGLGFLDLALLLEEMGRAALPGPFLSSVLGGLAIVHGGTRAQKKAWLPNLASGRALATIAFLEESDRLDAAGVTVRARKTRQGYRITGTKMFVADGHVADALVVALRTGSGREEGVTLFLLPRDTPGVTVHAHPSIDVTRRITEVRLRSVDVDASAVLGAPGRGWRTLRKILDAGAVAVAADCLGGAEKTLEMSVEYAGVRSQFGRPIGSFQAVKHIAAEMVSEIEPARSLLWYAAHAQDAFPRDASRAASMAKASLGEVYSRSANRAVQIHGGIGFTWEHDLHFWFKRSKWNEFAYGDPTYHRERLASLAKF